MRLLNAGFWAFLFNWCYVVGSLKKVLKKYLIISTLNRPNGGSFVIFVYFFFSEFNMIFIHDVKLTILLVRVVRASTRKPNECRDIKKNEKSSLLYPKSLLNIREDEEWVEGSLLCSLHSPVRSSIEHSFFKKTDPQKNPTRTSASAARLSIRTAGYRCRFFPEINC